jgi:glycosyltransferase involved in cell wall biosynthesis
VPIRVLHVVPAVAPRYGGPSTAVFGMCRALAAEGVETLVATTDADGAGRLDVPLGEVVRTGGTSTIYFRRRGSEAYKWAQGLSLWLSGHVRDYELVHVHAVFSYASMAAGRAALAANVPFVVRPLGTLDPWSVAHHRWRKRALLGLGLQRTLAAASAMHYTSAGEQQLAEGAHAWLPRGVVVPLGIDDALFAPGEQPDAAHPYVLTMSRLDRKKGIDLLIRAFHDVSGRRGAEQWRLVVAGDGDAAYVRDLKRLAASGPAAGRIVFTGWLDGARRDACVRRATLFTLPSAQENFGMALVEALACGVPAIVTPGVNLAPEISRAGAGWTVERSVADLATGLHTAIRDSGERAKRSAAARTCAQRFRWKVVGRALLDFYATVSRGALVGAAG